MLSACFGCGVPVDALRSAARVSGARVVQLCPECAGGRPKSEPSPPEPSPPEPPPKRRWNRGVLGASAIAAASLIGWAARGAAPVERVPQIVERAVPSPVPILIPLTARAPAPPPPPPPPPRPKRALPSSETVLPLEGAEHATPTAHGFFGAERPGERPAECGEGHCGIDLRAEEGTPVVAARAGVVQSVNRDADRPGGRYVWIDHPGGVSTRYFHLDSIVDRIEPGVSVEAGDVLGALGRTGVKSSPTHLHFAVTVDGVYVDPMRIVGSAHALARADSQN